MIRIEESALALNACNVPGPDYRMSQTVKLSKTATAIDVINSIQTGVKNSPGSYLKNVVINCHGSPGCLHVSKGEYLELQHVGLFNPMKNQIGTIWIVACQVAGESIGRAGRTFCPQLAQSAGCYVVAPEVYQWVNPGFYLRLFPKNCIDNYEGTVYRWDANGNKEVFTP